jgi:DNA-binding IclR family transcriptional regulator
VVALSHALLWGMPHRIAARPHLRAIADSARLPVSMGMRDGREMILIETARFDLGDRPPIATTAMGRAWLFGRTGAARADAAGAAGRDPAL